MSPLNDIRRKIEGEQKKRKKYEDLYPSKNTKKKTKEKR